MTDLLSLFNELDDSRTSESRDRAVQRALFPWPGGKLRSVNNILPYLPYRRVWVEVMGGSGVITINRQPSKLDVYNDRYGGVVAFYRCLRDANKYQEMVRRLELTMNAREEFVYAKENWEKCYDDVDRATLWYYMVTMSFGALGRNYGRRTNSGLQTYQRTLPLFSSIHERFKNVQVENLDWKACLQDYDSHETVFYIDPPYLNTDPGIYKHGFSEDDHRALLDQVQRTTGFVALSGYANPLYDSYKWDNRVEWEVAVSIDAFAFTDNNQEHLKDVKTRGKATEVLWIKEAG